MSEKLMLTDADLEEQAVMALPDRTLLQQTNYVAIFAVVAQTSFSQCNFCIQSNNNVIVG
jgi:hypothetical protein